MIAVMCMQILYMGTDAKIDPKEKSQRSKILEKALNYVKFWLTF